MMNYHLQMVGQKTDTCNKLVITSTTTQPIFDTTTPTTTTSSSSSSSSETPTTVRNRMNRANRKPKSKARNSTRYSMSAMSMDRLSDGLLTVATRQLDERDGRQINMLIRAWDKTGRKPIMASLLRLVCVFAMVRVGSPEQLNQARSTITRPVSMQWTNYMASQLDGAWPLHQSLETTEEETSYVTVEPTFVATKGRQAKPHQKLTIRLDGRPEFWLNRIEEPNKGGDDDNDNLNYIYSMTNHQQTNSPKSGEPNEVLKVEADLMPEVESLQRGRRNNADFAAAASLGWSGVRSTGNGRYQQLPAGLSSGEDDEIRQLLGQLAEPLADEQRLEISVSEPSITDQGPILLVKLPASNSVETRGRGGLANGVRSDGKITRQSVVAKEQTQTATLGDGFNLKDNLGNGIGNLINRRPNMRSSGSLLMRLAGVPNTPTFRSQRSNHMSAISSSERSSDNSLGGQVDGRRLDGEMIGQPEVGNQEPVWLADGLDVANMNSSISPFECNKRLFSFRATKTDEAGNTCSGLVTANICVGGCDSGEIADWLFPHKKSIHTACMHGQRVRKRQVLEECSSPEVGDSLREYSYVDAVTCVCQKCNPADTTCLGTLTRPSGYLDGPWPSSSETGT